MKAAIHFNLNDRDDAMAHLRCIKSTDMALALWDFSRKLNAICDVSEDGKHIDEADVRAAFIECLTENNINLDELIN